MALLGVVESAKADRTTETTATTSVQREEGITYTGVLKKNYSAVLFCWLSYVWGVSFQKNFSLHIFLLI